MRLADVSLFARPRPTPGHFCSCRENEMLRRRVLCSTLPIPTGQNKMLRCQLLLDDPAPHSEQILL